jgi:hypothetical protein
VENPIALFAFSRRGFLVAALAAFAGGRSAVAAETPGPLAVMTAIYQAAVKDQGPSWIDEGERAQYLSKSLVALWAQTDKKIVPGDEGPIDFDIVADTNGLSLSGFSLAVEKQGPTTATIAATLAYKDGDAGPKPKVVRYDLVRENGRWKIDEIHSDSWSVRALLSNFLRP